MDISPHTRRLSEALTSQDGGTEQWPWEVIEELRRELDPSSEDITANAVEAVQVRENPSHLRTVAGSLALSVAGSMITLPAFADTPHTHTGGNNVVVASGPNDPDKTRILRAGTPGGGGGSSDETRQKVAEKVGELSDAARKYGGRISDKVKHDESKQSDEAQADQAAQTINKDELDRSVRRQEATQVPGGHFHGADEAGTSGAGKNADTQAQQDQPAVKQHTPQKQDKQPVPTPTPDAQQPPNNQQPPEHQQKPEQQQPTPVPQKIPPGKQPSAQPQNRQPARGNKARYPDTYNPKPVDYNGTQVVFPVNIGPDAIIKHPKAWDYRTAKNYHHAEAGGGALLAADIQALSGTPVESPVSGKVTFVEDDGKNPNGSRVELLSDNGKHIFVLTHLERGVLAKPGMAVKIGESRIGVLKDFGPAKKYDSHLHIEVKDARTGARLNVQELMRDAFAAELKAPAQPAQSDSVTTPDEQLHFRPADPVFAAKVTAILKSQIPAGHFPVAEGTAPAGETQATQHDDAPAGQTHDDLSRVRDILKDAKPEHASQPQDPNDLSRVREILKNAHPGQATHQTPDSSTDNGQGTQSSNGNKPHANQHNQGNGKNPEVTSKAAGVVTQDVVKKMMPGVRDEVLGVCYPLIMNALEEKGIDSVDMALYAFATVKIETGVTVHGKNMTCAPIEELGKGGGRYRTGNGNFYGRGYIQLTWEYNYRSYGKAIGEDLLHNSSRALDPHTAARVLAEYLYRNKDRLNRDFSSGNIADARRVVNGGTNGLWSFKQSLNAGKRAIHR